MEELEILSNNWDKEIRKMQGNFHKLEQRFLECDLEDQIKKLELEMLEIESCVKTEIKRLVDEKGGKAVLSKLRGGTRNVPGVGRFFCKTFSSVNFFAFCFDSKLRHICKRTNF
ncbi:hypothetical protein ACHQM5_003206 [Ranunculus cassubicifolius]